MAVWLAQAAGSVAPQGDASPYFRPDLLGTSPGRCRRQRRRTGYGSGLRKLRCTPSVHMMVSTKGGKTRSGGWSLNYIRVQHDPASLGILHDPLGLLPVIYNYRHPEGVRGLGPIRLGGEPLLAQAWRGA